jgi:hypothetical protein
LTIVTEDTYFDQTMGFERQIGFFDDRSGQSIVSNHDDRVKMMRQGAVVFAFSRGELDSRHRGIIFFVRG